MVALNEQFHDYGTRPRLQGTGYGLQRSGESGVNVTDQGTLITDQKRRTSNDLFIDHYSLVIERSACANEIIYGGYPDGNRVSTDIGTGLSDPESELYYVRNRTYNSIPGTALRQEPKSRKTTGVATRVLQRAPIGYAGGINLYEHVGGRAVVGLDPMGLAYLQGVGPIHEMGGCNGSVCRFYRNYYYYVGIGRWDVPAGPKGSLLTKFAHAVATLSGAGRLINLLMSGVTLSTPEYACFFWLTWKDTRVFTYKCGTHYLDVRWQSTTRHEDFQVHDKPIPQGWGPTGNNLVVPAPGETLKDIGHNMTDLVMEIIDAMEGAE